MRAFISYDYVENQTFVDELAVALREAGLTPSIINLRLVYGDELLYKADAALKNWDYVIVVLSKSYVKSKWLEKELTAFLMQEKLSKRNIILPVLIEECEVPALLEDRVIDFRDVPFAAGVELLLSHISKTRQAFVVMKYGAAELDSAFYSAIRPTLEEFGYSVRSSAQGGDGAGAADEALRELEKSEIVLVELTGGRQDCYYEAGYAHALGKPLIFSLREGDQAYIDLRDHRIIIWRTEQELKERLRGRLEAVLNERNVLKSLKTKAANKATAPHKSGAPAGPPEPDAAEPGATKLRDKRAEGVTGNLVFISYSHNDEKWLKRLKVHLKPLERAGEIEYWDDTRIKPGTLWREELRRAIDSASAAVLLVSADFLASDFIATDELPPLLASAQEKGTVILPLIVSPCRFSQTESLSQFQAVNSPSQALDILGKKGKQEEILLKLTLAIEEALYG